MRIFERQALHATLLCFLVFVCYQISGIPSFTDGHLWSLPTLAWFWLAVVIAVVHQVYVWFCWRIQLHHQFLTSSLGDWGFPMYRFGFAVLGILRVVMVFLVAISNRETLGGNDRLWRLIAVLLGLPAAYTFYSVTRYLGFSRATGADHFDPAYRTIPFVRKGIFRFSSNSMYVFGFLLMWGPGFWFTSVAGLSIAAFNHLYIWVHYHCTERPDLALIYGGATVSQSDCE